MGNLWRWVIYPYNLIKDKEGLLPAHHAKRGMEKIKNIPWTIAGILILLALISSGGD